MKKIIILMALVLSFVAAPPVAAAKPVVTGTLTIEATSELVHGGHLDATMVTSGRLSHGSAVYTTVVLKQGAQVVYAWSEFAPYASFPLVQQDGFAALGLFIDPTLPAEGSAALIYRQPSGKGYTYTFLDRATFTVPSGG